MERIGKIDLHVHVVPEKDLPKPGGINYPTPDELRRMYDVLDIEGGVLLPQGSAPEGTCDRLSQREAYNMVSARPDVFAGWFCNVDPRQGKNSAETDFRYYLEYYKAKGARGVGEMTAPLDVDDPRMMKLFAAAQECHMPVLMHYGTEDSAYGVRDAMGFPHLEHALNEFPELMFIGHSAQFWCEISGGVTEEIRRTNCPKGKVACGGAVVRLMRKYKNLYAEISSLSGANALMRDPEFTYDFLAEFAGRLYYGTDLHDPRNLETYPDYVQLRDFLEEGRASGRIAESTYRALCRDNAAKLLNGEWRV